MKALKKVFVLVMFISQKLYSQTTLQTLIALAMQNNADITAATLSYESSSLSARTLDGYFSPSLSVNSSTTLDKNYDWKANPSAFSSSVLLSQPIPGGFVLGVNGSVGFSTYEGIDFVTNETLRYMKQTPSLSLSLSSSLLPFWAQGTIHNPSILSLKQQNQYAYNQLLYTKKQVIEKLLQNYCFAVTSKKQIQIYENSIELIQNQIDAIKQLQKTGNVSLSKITELENTKWNYQQDLLSVVVNYEGYFQSIKNLCGSDFESDLNFNQETDDNILSYIFEQIDEVSDPCLENLQLKLEMLETTQIAQKQSSAPVLSLSVTPTWELDETKEEEWKNAWKTEDAYKSWSASVGIDFSPLFAAASKKSNKHSEIEYKSAQKNLESYITQKEFIQNQYNSIIQIYESQLQTVSTLVEEGKKEMEDMELQFKTGAISALDFDSVKTQVNNSVLSKECLEINCWMYKILKKIL